MNYEEILKCYEGETDIHASTSFEFGLMNDLYYQLFYSYPEVDKWRYAAIAGTLMTKRLKTMTVAFFLVSDLNVEKVINLTYISTGIVQ